MIKLLKIDSLHVVEEVVPGASVLVACKPNNQITNMQLAKCIEPLDIFLHAHAIKAQHIALSVCTVLLLYFADTVIRRVRR
jgi:hypothetical protein